jgi:DNA (cytosine-5)-methyltransferase 1
VTDRLIQEKISRLRTGAKPRVLDLFSGCGGLSLGFGAAGFEIAAAVENNPTAAASYGANFHADDPLHAVARDITATTPGQLVRELKLGRVAEAFDVVIGGPPCQAFARVGRSKLREIEAHPEAFRQDPRAKLYTPYLTYVKSCRPLAILMENVPDVMNFGGHNVPEEVCEVLEELGYVCAYTLLNAAFYGVPQTRERMFLIAYHREMAGTVGFPKPTHWIDLPPGYEGSRQVALKLLSKGGLFEDAHSYVSPPEATDALLPAITAAEAIGDLPKIDARDLVRKGELKRGARRFDQLTRYDGRRTVSAYADAMKTWPGFTAGEGVYDHVIRYLPRDYPLFARMKEGDQYPEAHALALKMFEEKLSALAKKGLRITPGSAEYEELKSSIVPPYDAGKFPNKWRKISRDQPVRTIMAHLSKDGYSHIHYDDIQARTISVREAARLQSFPDGFVFSGAMNEAFRQIGNAVPPLMAKAIATEIMKTIRASAGAHPAQPTRIPVAAAAASETGSPALARGRAAMEKVVEA